MFITIDEREFELIEVIKKNKKKIKEFFLPIKWPSISTDFLELGDILINDKIIIERKTTEDFLSSIHDGRLFSQLHNIKKLDQSIIKILLLEGRMTVYQSKKIVPCLCSFILFGDIKILWAKNIKQTYKIILYLTKAICEKPFKKGKKLRELIKDFGIEQKKKFKTKESTFLRMLLQIHGINIETAITLGLKTKCSFGNLYNIIKNNEIKNIKTLNGNKHLSENVIENLQKLFS